jgi:hypothetical protein
VAGIEHEVAQQRDCSGLSTRGACSNGHNEGNADKRVAMFGYQASYKISRATAFAISTRRAKIKRETLKDAPLNSQPLTLNHSEIIKKDRWSINSSLIGSRNVLSHTIAKSEIPPGSIPCWHRKNSSQRAAQHKISIKAIQSLRTTQPSIYVLRV